MVGSSFEEVGANPVTTAKTRAPSQDRPSPTKGPTKRLSKCRHIYFNFLQYYNLYKNVDCNICAERHTHGEGRHYIEKCMNAVSVKQ